MRIPPPEVLASWPPPNYDNPVARGPALLITELVITPLAVAVLLARLHCRITKVHNSGLDDWLMAAATVFSVGVTICVILATQLYGWNIHTWDLTIHQAIRGRQVSIAAQTLFVAGSSLTKLSILVSYLRIALLDSWFRKLTQICIWVVTALTLVFFIVLWSQCIPIEAYWDFSPNGHCIPEGPPLMAQTITSVMTDFMVYLLPLPMLIRLRLRLSQRIALIVVFSLGFVVVLAGCQRTFWMHYVVDETYDVTWGGYEMWIWTAVEVNLGVICGSLPTLRPLFRSKEEATRRASGATPSLPRITSAQTNRTSTGSGVTGSGWLVTGAKGSFSQGGGIDAQRNIVEGYREIKSPEPVFELRKWIRDRTCDAEDESARPARYN